MITKIHQTDLMELIVWWIFVVIFNDPPT